jgi:subtilisin family serine protease
MRSEVPSRRRARTALAVALIGAVISVWSVNAANAGPSAARDEAPLLGTNDADAIAGRYIVVMKNSAERKFVASASESVKAMGGSVTQTYRHAVKGFSAEMSPDAVAELRQNPDVAYIEADAKVTLTETQNNATWGIDRVDQRNRPLSTTYNYTSTGSGVTAYIIDTGILTSHNDLRPRAVSGYSAINDGRGTTDCNGHGTHVSGTVGGSTYGVAKGVRLVAVRVLDCGGSGSNSGVIAGIDWVTGNHTSGPAVANMSLGGGASSALDSALNNSINDGVTYAVAAGNSNTTACNTSPARVPAAITVGATTNTDARSSFSNYGTCLDIFAPGSNITSAWYSSDTATNTISGTSMASPHTAGVAARYLSVNPSASPAEVSNALTGNATSGVVTSPGSGSPNRLLYAPPDDNWGSTPPPSSTTTTTPPPTTQPCQWWMWWCW